MTIQRHHANPQSACGRAELYPKDGSEGSPLVAGYLPSSPATRMHMEVNLPPLKVIWMGFSSLEAK